MHLGEKWAELGLKIMAIILKIEILFIYFMLCLAQRLQIMPETENGDREVRRLDSSYCQKDNLGETQCVFLLASHKNIFQGRGKNYPDVGRKVTEGGITADSHMYLPWQSGCQNLCWFWLIRL